jgi:hypothetical protein
MSSRITLSFFAIGFGIVVILLLVRKRPVREPIVAAVIAVIFAVLYNLL